MAELKTLTTSEGTYDSFPDKTAREALKKMGADVTAYGLPVLELTGDISPIRISKDNKVTLSYVYGDRRGSCTLKGQGATSYKIAQQLGDKGKFNYTIKFDEAFEAMPGWGAQQKYCLKANWIDATHSRNICSCRQWGLIVKSRATVPAELANLPNGGAIDGFPVIIMLNGAFHGLYTFNIPKDGWMFGLVENAAKTQAIVGADDHTAATRFKEASMDGFDVEFVSDEENADWVEQSLTRMISAVVNSDGSDLDTVVAQYLDWDSAIDYYIHVVADKATDCVDKNYLLVTFDGTKWFFSNYDRDSIHGLNWDASGTTRPTLNESFQECAAQMRVFELIYRFKTDALKARANALLADILSEAHTMKIFENFAWAIPSPVALEDIKRWPSIKGSFVNTIDQIGRFVRRRRETMSKWIAALPAQEQPPTTGGYTNLVPTSTDIDGSIYNGTGYADNTRLKSADGNTTTQAGSVTTGFMLYPGLGIIRLKGARWTDESGMHYFVIAYGPSHEMKAYIGAAEHAGGTPAGLRVEYDASTGVTTIDFSSVAADNATRAAFASAQFIRLNAKGKGSDLIVTVNEEISA